VKDQVLVQEKEEDIGFPKGYDIEISVPGALA
jgi:hypothetical protein